MFTGRVSLLEEYGRGQSSSVSPRGGGYGSSASTPHSSNGGGGSYGNSSGGGGPAMNGGGYGSGGQLASMGSPVSTAAGGLFNSSSSKLHIITLAAQLANYTQ